jgi:hypothetical protein
MKQEIPRNGLPGSFWDVAKDIMGASPTLANCGPFEGLEAKSDDLGKTSDDLMGAPNRSSSIIPTKEGGIVLSMTPIMPDEDDDKREART